MFWGVFMASLGWVIHKNATRFVWLTWHDTAKKVASRVGGVPAYCLLQDACGGFAFTLLSTYLLAGNGPMKLREGLRSQMRWLDDYQQAVFYAVARYVKMH